MTTPTVDDLISSLPASLGSYAPVVAEIQSVLQSRQCSIAVVAGAIEKDPDLTARLLRLANSAFYGFPTRLATVNEAISLIGLKQVEDLILVSSIIDRFLGVASDYVDMQSFWRHSLACGIGARLMAMARRIPTADKFFVAGLLHDLGRLVLFTQAPEVCRTVFDLQLRQRMLLREAEQRVLGYHHADVGAALLRRWQFPVYLSEAVGFHHAPAAGDRGREPAAIVHVSDHLANALSLGTSGERHVPTLHRAAWELLRLPVTSLAELMRDIEDQTEKVQEAFLQPTPTPAKP